MPTCPSGHDSAATDFCDICGMRIEGAAASSASLRSATAALASPEPGGTGPTGGTEPPGETESPAAQASPCPQCGTGRSGRFCEVCGYDFSSGAPPRPAVSAAGPAANAGPAATGAGPAAAPVASAATPVQGPGAGWTAVVTADRAYFDAVIAAGGPDAASIQFPAYCPERRFALAGRELRIGRRSPSRGLDPEIDLTGPPTDPGISHLHAVLIAQPDGTWSVLDPGSSNGTQVNGQDIAPGVAVPLHDGDRVCLGAWTVLAIAAG